MPYIEQYERDMAKDFPNSSGQLNFAIHKVIEQYLNRFDYSYNVLNGVVGVLECVKLEMYRRLIGPYEDEKIKENGDIELYE